MILLDFVRGGGRERTGALADRARDDRRGERRPRSPDSSRCPAPVELFHDAAGKFEDAFRNVREAAESALAALRGGDLNPDAVELEFGVKLNAAAGAVIAKTSVEGHLKVKMTWGRPRPEEPETT